MTIDAQPEKGETRVPRQNGAIWDNRTEVANHSVPPYVHGHYEVDL
jgi:hypothetical protein